MTHDNDDRVENVSTLAGTGTIEGTVTDGTDDPIEGVTVQALYPSRLVAAESATDATGAYTVEVPGNSTYTVRFERAMHESAEVPNVSVGAGTVATVDQTLSRRPYKTAGDFATERGVGVVGNNTATSGETAGIVGASHAAQRYGTGVRGTATNPSAARTIGVDGRSLSSSGIGVRGNGSIGVKGLTDDRYGVHGLTIGSSGSVYGVVGETHAPDGRGVMGTATDFGTVGPRSDPMGVYGETDRSGANSSVTAAYGVRGKSNAGSGLAYGVSGLLKGDDGAGAYGEADTYDGVAGVLGRTTPTYTARSGTSYGVRGETGSTGLGSAGIKGMATAGSGQTYGVYGTTSSDDASAAAVYAAGKLRAVGSTTTSATSLTDHVAHIEDTQTEYSSVLALQVGENSPTSGDNFATFYTGDGTAIGSIGATGSGGVSLDTSGADYAEHLPRADPAAVIEPGDVVGVSDGAVSKQTAHADRVLVVSDQPAVTGNSPGQNASEYETAAFTGQVPVRVRGTVETGDVIVPSGEDDGTAVAVSPDKWTPGSAIVGQAWEGSDEAGISEVTVAVGIGDEDVLASALSDLQAENAALHERVDDLESRLCDLEASASTPASADD